MPAVVPKATGDQAGQAQRLISSRGVSNHSVQVSIDVPKDEVGSLGDQLERLFAIGDKWAERQPVDLEALDRLLEQRATGPIKLDNVIINVGFHSDNASRTGR